MSIGDEREHRRTYQYHGDLGPMYARDAAVRAHATTDGEPMVQCPTCGWFGDTGYPDNDAECPSCGGALPKFPSHLLVPIIGRKASDNGTTH